MSDDLPKWGFFNDIEFRQIPGDYRYVSIDGKILSMRQGKPKLVKARPDKDNYLKVSRPEIKIHHAVLRAWKSEKPPGHQGRHLDGNNQNNHADNLEWGTKKQNGEDKRRHGTAKGILNPAARMTEEFVLDLRQSGMRLCQLKRMHPYFSPYAIWAAVRGATWSHLPGAIKA